MEIELPDDFARRVNGYVDPARGITPLTVLQQAVDSFEARKGPASTAGSAEELVDRFRRFRGMLGGLDREQLIADRHAGLA